MVIDFANTTINHMNLCNKGQESTWQGFYNVMTDGISSITGACAGTIVTGLGTASSYGTMTVPAVAAGIAFGSAITSGLKFGFDQLEKSIWGNAQ